MQRGDLGAHRHAQFGVEVRQRLVEQEDARLAHDGAADRDALALAAGELRRPALEQRVEPQQAAPRCGPCRRSPRAACRCSRGRTPCSGTPSCAGTARTTGTPSPGPRSAADTSFTRTPSISTSPLVTFSRPQMRRSSVDLPQPDGPTKTTNSPSATARSTPWMTRVASNVLGHLPQVQGRHAHFTPAEAMPWVMYFCRNAKTSVTGSSVITVMASR